MLSFKNWILSEIKSSDLSKVGQRVNEFSRKEFDKIPFNDIFGNKYRIIIPIGNSQQISFVNALEQAGYEVDLKQGMVSSKIQTLQGISERKQRIGKAIQGLIKKDPTTWQPHLKWWEQNKDKLNNQTSGISVIISRHPIDIVRMSDHDEWRSCHSTDGDYFACAIQEAKTGGAIAYVVQNKDLQNIKNLQAKDIFNDDDRGINGIHPLERLRLRRLAGNNKDILLPELRTYGIKHVGLYDTVKNWLKLVQKDKLKDIDYGDLKLKGGSYKDNTIASLWNNFFDTDEVSNDKFSVDQKSAGSTAKIEEIERRVARGLEDHKYEHVHAFGEAYDDGEGPYVLFGGGVTFSFPYKNFNKNIHNYIFEGDNANENQERFMKNLSDTLLDTNLKIVSIKGKFVHFGFDYYTDEMGHTLEDFEGFLDWLDQEDNEYFKNKERIREVLEEYELLNNVHLEFKHFTIVNNNDSVNRSDEIELRSEDMMIGQMPDWVLNHDGASKRLIPKKPVLGKKWIWNNFNPHLPHDYDALFRTNSMGIEQIFGKIIKYHPDLPGKSNVKIAIDEKHVVYLQIYADIKKDDEKEYNRFKYIDKNWEYFHRRAMQWFNLMLSNIKTSIQQKQSFEKPLADPAIMRSIANLQRMPIDLGKVKPTQYKQPLLPFKRNFKEFFLASF